MEDLSNSEVFNHIIYKGSRSERERPSEILRFKLLPLVLKLVKISTTYQEYIHFYNKAGLLNNPLKNFTSNVLK
jgi:hypothetical protein